MIIDIEAFNPVDTNETYNDKENEIWTQKTATGWQRNSDMFFWPFHPENNPFPPSKDEVAKEREQRLKK